MAAQQDPSYQNAPTNYDDIGGATQFQPLDTAPRQRKQVTILGRLLDYELFVAKAFYFFFYAAFGSLFPLIAVYFKQLGMNATQAGVLIGIRPFLEYASSPFWGSFADRFRKGKILLLFALFCWIFFTLALSWIQPGTPYCLAHNRTANFEYISAPRSKRSAGWAPGVAGEGPAGLRPDQLVLPAHLVPSEGLAKVRRRRQSGQAPANAHPRVPGMAPEYLDPAVVRGYDPEETGELVRPPTSTRVYRQSSVEEVFMLMLLTVCLGEFFSSPAMGLVDSVVLSSLGAQPELYGKQRIWGSGGWGLAMFIVGLALDSTVFPDHPCGKLELHEKNYNVCFSAFTILMTCAFIVATQFTFPETPATRSDEVASKIMDANVGYVDPLLVEKAKERAPEAAAVEGKGWASVLRTFATPHYGAFLLVTWWMGFGVGLVFSFLFWHLQDLGGSPSLFGIASVINHISEVAAYFFSFRLINRIGHVKVLYVGLWCNALRFLYVCVLTNPWLVLPFEFVQGISHAAVWAAATSYISLAAPAEQKAQAQGLLQGLHHGVGKGCGALVGGLIITYNGTRTMFVWYAVLCLLIFLAFFMVNRFAKPPVLRGSTDGEAPSLAPHGVPAVGVDVNDRFGRPPQGPPQGYQNAPAPDPQQAAYDAYVAGGKNAAYDRPVAFDALPSGPRR